MKITILVDCYYPRISGGAKLIHDLASEFIRQGHEATIITPLETIENPHELEHVDIGCERPIHIVRVRTGRIKGARKILRAIEEYRLPAHVWRKAGQYLSANPADLILYYSPSIFWGPLVRRLKKLWRCPAYLILRDIFPQWAVDTGVLRKGLAWRLLRWKEREQYLVADVIAVQSPSDLSYFDREFPALQIRKEVLFNWNAAHEPGLSATSYRNLWGLEGKVVFLYGGNIGVAQDLDNILRLAASLQEEKEIQFVLVGSGSEVERLNRRIDLERLANIRIFPPLEPRQYLSMLSEFDIGLLSLDSRLTTHNVPGKLLGYLYSGLPVLASLNSGSDLFPLIEGQRAGICLTNGDHAGLRAATLRMARDAGLRKELGVGARKLLESAFSVESAARQILRNFPTAGENNTAPRP